MMCLTCLFGRYHGAFFREVVEKRLLV